MDFFQLPAWHSYLCLSIYIFSASCARMSVPIVFRYPQHSPDVSTLDRDILQLVGQQWWPIHYSMDLDSSTDHRDDAISSMMISLLLLPVFLLLSCTLSLKFFFVSSFHIDCASTGNSSIAISVLDCWETNIASGLRLVSTMLGKTNFLSRSILSSQSFPLSSNDVRLVALESAVDSPCFTNYICLCFVYGGRFLFLSTFNTSATAGRCHAAIYISPESELLGILENMHHGPSLSTQLTVLVFT